jgi:hypothetical protein
MSGGTTYSRTSGTAILPATWQAVQSRHPDQMLRPSERVSWDGSTHEQQQAFIELTARPLTQPPEFLRFNLERNPYLPGQYPGAVPKHLGHPANGHLPDGTSLDRVADQLGISVPVLTMELRKFSGQVSAVKLLSGTRIYRTVGLTAENSLHGCVTNRLIGEYWERRHPCSYQSLEDWRSQTAVLAEWNGDYGYLEIEIENELVVLEGTVGMQVVDVACELVLPGGGLQVYVPNAIRQLGGQAHRLQSTAIKSLIRPTQFGTMAL